MTKKTFIFDLDGVIVDTAKYHFLAWRNLANELGIDFSEEDNEQLKGVSRVRSLEKILSWGNKTLSQNEFNKLLVNKNEEYLIYINKMNRSEILADVPKVLNHLKTHNQSIALGSASKNAKSILEKIQLSEVFDTIVDGNDVSKAKPDPEVFLEGAKRLHANPKDCIVFEDSVAGIQAANNAKMLSIGVGNKTVLHEADFIFNDFTELTTSFLNDIISGHITKQNAMQQKTQ